MVVEILESREKNWGCVFEASLLPPSYSARGNFGHNYTEVTNIPRVHGLM